MRLYCEIKYRQMLLNFYRHTFSFLSQNEDKPNLYVRFRKKAEAVLNLCKDTCGVIMHIYM